jgi:hypothetical protein
MTKFFFDFRQSGVLATDDEGVELTDAGSAHGEALGSLVDAICDVMIEGQSGQRFAVEVRDELGPVLEITAVFASKILRKQ